MTSRSQQRKASAPNALFDDLRGSVIEQLGYDAEDLRPWQESRAHSLVLLYLERDRVTTAALRGEAVDAKAVAVVAEQIERLLNPAFGGDSSEATERANESARETLAGLIERVRIADEHEAREQECDLMLREEMAAVAAAQPVSAPQPTLSVVDNAAPAPPPVRFVEHDTVTIIDGTCTEVTPPKPTKQSQTFAAFARHIEQQGNSLKQGDAWSPPPSGW